MLLEENYMETGQIQKHPGGVPMKAILTILMTIIMTALLAGCATNNANDDKEVTMTTKTFDLKDFTRIEVGGAFEVDIARGDSFNITVTADDFPHVRVEALNDTLIIRRQGIEWFAPFHSRPRATVTLPVLTDLDISGASHGKFRDFQSGENLTVKLSGASHLEAVNISSGGLDVRASGASSLTGAIKTTQDAKFEASGASRIELTGTGANIVMKINGASKAELGDFPVQNANLDVSGASHALVNLNGRLDANVSGASKLFWSGTPVMGDIQSSGASNLRHK
jgi:hypothetical protein